MTRYWNPSGPGNNQKDQLQAHKPEIIARPPRPGLPANCQPRAVANGADAGAVVDVDETSDTNEVGMCTISSPLSSLTTSGTVAFVL
jgi:hypothetical protein